jgi:hypothetical protein
VSANHLVLVTSHSARLRRAPSIDTASRPGHVEDPGLLFLPGAVDDVHGISRLDPKTELIDVLRDGLCVASRRQEHQKWEGGECRMEVEASCISHPRFSNTGLGKKVDTMLTEPYTDGYNEKEYGCQALSAGQQFAVD